MQAARSYPGRLHWPDRKNCGKPDEYLYVPLMDQPPIILFRAPLEDENRLPLPNNGPNFGEAGP